jgi:hypothetical protein
MRHRSQRTAQQRLVVLIALALGSCAEPEHEIILEMDTPWASSVAAAPQDPSTSIASQSAADDVSQAPAWYNGSKPWSEIPPEARRKMRAMRAAYEAQQATARQTGTGREDQASVDGRSLIERIVREYQLDPVYKEPETFGGRMVIWVPIDAWNKLSASQRQSLEAYMSSKYTNWGIGVGRVQGRDVLYDKVVVKQ